MAHGFAIYIGAAGAEQVFFSDAVFNMRFYTQETLAAGNSGTQYSYPDLAGKQVVAFTQPDSGGSRPLVGRRYHCTIDYTQGFPRVTMTYANYAANGPAANDFGGTLFVFVIN